MNPSQAPSVFDHIDYRKFLQAYYDYSKANHSFFSYRYFSNKAGIKSPVFLKLIIDGKRNLTQGMLEKFLKALNLPSKENLYFSHLVGFNQAQTPNVKQKHYIQMRTLSDSVKEHVLESDKYDFYSNWYHSVIRELICMYDFGDDFEMLAGTLVPKISVAQAQESVNLLLKLKLVARQQDGTYVQRQQAITTGSEVVSLAIRNFNEHMMDLAKQSLGMKLEERNISGITMGIPKDKRKMVEGEIAAFVDKLVNIINAKTDLDKVYQLNIQFFPLSRDLPEK